MQVLYDDAIIDGPELLGVLRLPTASCGSACHRCGWTTGPAIWWAISLPYRLSVNYEVRVSTSTRRRPTTSSPVQVRDLAFGIRPMTVRELVGIERRLSASPVWLRLVDTFTGEAPVGPVEVDDRAPGRARLGAARLPLPATSRAATWAARSRAEPGWPGRSDLEPQDHRRLLRRPSPKRPAARADIQLTVPGWGAGHPPAAGDTRGGPLLSRAGLPLPPGTPVLSGRVVNAAVQPVSRGPGHRHRDGAGRRRSSRRSAPATTAGSGCRCAGPAGSTTIDADRLGAAGSATINLPADLGSVVLIQIS